MECGYAFDSLVTQVAAHPAEHTLAVGFSDGTVLVCEIEGDAIIARPAQGSAISSLAWAPDGIGLLAGAEDGRLASLRIAPAEG